MSTECVRCHKSLTDPGSVRAGIGPICRGKVFNDAEEEGREIAMFIKGGFEGDVICRRDENGARVNIPHLLVRHSPDGFEWGYGGSGPADLALNVLAQYIGSERAQNEGLYQAFKWKFIATMPREGGVIKRDDVFRWLEEQVREVL